MSTKNMAYDHPAYLSRLSYNTIMTAGSGGVSAKFVAHANMQLFSINSQATVAGTSTYTTTVTGSTTVNVATTQMSLIRITNTASAGATISLSTSTIGPFTMGGGYIVSGTQTNQVGAFASFPLNTSTGSAGLNGLSINQGDQFYVVNGTDATAVNLISIDAQIQPLASITA
jgi:hypothetical protein